MNKEQAWDEYMGAFYEEEGRLGTEEEISDRISFYSGYAHVEPVIRRLAVAEAIISRARYCLREEYPRPEVIAVLSNKLPPLE